MKTNTLYFGDNLEVMRGFPDACVDLVYADPPFNSARNYFVIFKDRTGKASAAQDEAFTDTWTWGEESEGAYRALVMGSNAPLATATQALRTMLGETPMMAYLVAMAIRFVEIHRVLKPTGSFYLHCDTTASHYLKVLLDTVFGPTNFRNEIVWKRTNAHNDPKRFGRIHDVILYYAKNSRQVYFAPQYVGYDPSYIQSEFRQDADGRWYKCEDLTAPGHGGASGRFEFHGRTPGASRMWRMKETEMERLWGEGRIRTDANGVPLLRGQVVYLDEKKGMTVQDWWDDVLRIGNTSGERLGYPTQKPLALLERIIAASSREGDVVLDPFCGCGTTVHAAHKLGRHWVGIDVTAVAIAVIKTRLETAFDDLKGKVQVEGFPQDYESARQLFEIDPHRFQVWANTLIDAYPLTKKGADAGIDGWLNFLDLDDKAHRAVVQVKGGKLTLSQVRDFCHVVTREKATLGFLVCLGEPTGPMRQEAIKEGFWTDAGDRTWPKVQILPVAELLAGTVRARYPAQDKVSMLGYKAGKAQKRGQQQEMFAD